MFSTLVILSTLSPLISNTTISSTIHQKKRQGHLHNLGGDFHDVDVDVDLDVDFNVDLDTDMMMMLRSMFILRSMLLLTLKLVFLR